MVFFWRISHRFLCHSAKEAAEGLGKRTNAGEAAEKLKQQAEAATSVIGEKLDQAQKLGKATMEELFKGSPTFSSTSDTSSDAKDTQQEKHADTNDASTSTSSQDHQQQQQPKQGPTVSSADKLRNFVTSAFKEMKAAVLPEPPKASALRGAAVKASDIPTTTVTELAIAQAAEESSWQRQWREMGDKLSGHAFFRHVASGLRDNRVMKAGGDVADSLRERWETSDSAFVHRIQDATDSLFQESEAAQALREIRGRDPGFDMVEFLRLLRADVPLLIKAYLTGDEGVIKEHCSPEMIERLTGIMKAQAAAGLVPDATLLDTSEVELVDLKILDDQPIIVTQFTCQQINCTRDGHGNVVEGAPDEVHRVYYYWAVQQEAQGYVGEDGKVHPPRWQLREMMIRGMHHLL